MEKKIHLPRPAASGVGITAGICLLLLAVLLPGTLLLRQVQKLSFVLPQAQRFIQSALQTLEDWLLQQTARIPEALGQPLQQGVISLFSGGAAMMTQLARPLLDFAAGMVPQLASGAVSFGTALLSSYLISARLPKIRDVLRRRLPASVRRCLPLLRSVKTALLGWFRAQARLALAAAGIISVSFFILGIPAPLLWGGILALVDAVPMLGTGTVLVPWSLLALMQGDQRLFFGLLITYGLTALCRGILEPRLVGQSMGLDPLMTLAALYLGYRVWGLAGMILAPPAAAAAIRLCRLYPGQSR